MADEQNKNDSSETFDSVAWHKNLIAPDRYRGKSSVLNREIDEEALSAAPVCCIPAPSADFSKKRKSSQFPKMLQCGLGLHILSVGRWVAQKVVDGPLAGLEKPYLKGIISRIP